jgi:glycosyltransferase involved in cell wall biosynthesis
VTWPVSVVLPVKNGARFIEDALGSVVREDVAQIVVVDDGSSDNTVEIVNKYLKRLGGIVAWQLHEFGGSHGVGKARNHGLRCVTEDWIALIDADDIWMPGKTSYQLALLRGLKHPKRAFTSSLVEHFIEPGYEVPDTLRKEKLGTIPLFFPSNLLCHREVFERVGGFDPDLVCANDVDWYRRALALGIERLHIDEMLVKKRVHDQNLSLCQGHDMMKQIMRVVKRPVEPGMFPIW